ncbi:MULTISPECIES: hypothetical protein [Streptomyces]|uniref:Tat pathway signal sequence domain protein n=1 Tax=Streptomyces cacaoi TaxID=1898 RepID=A0A4Y3R031_STRCI|nr:MULTISPECIES: hypothetical protein [Streptomyces]NNG83576.1 hypothetical protein [Streptomyces cacaoi]GEB49520.1 hypothetical protein SCA03_20710 [Streptomyces cacaoi]
MTSRKSLLAACFLAGAVLAGASAPALAQDSATSSPADNHSSSVTADAGGTTVSVRDDNHSSSS